MKAVIFGVNGQDGPYLSEILRRDGVDVAGVSRSSGQIVGNVAEAAFVDALIRDQRPDYVFHLAANSTTRHDTIRENHDSICTGTLNILESVRQHVPEARVFLSGSGLQFVNSGKPIDENAPFEASSAYSMARIQSVYAGRYFRSKLGLKVYFGYFFHHDSPRRSERHVNRKIAAAANRIARGSQEKLPLGNIDVRKEFNFAGDSMEAIWTLVQQDRVFEAVIGSGEAHSIREWLEACFSRVGLRWEDHVTTSNDFQPEFQVLVSNPAVLRSLGWKPKVSFEQLAALMMEEA